MPAPVRSLVSSRVHGDADASETASRPERAAAERRETLLRETLADFDARGVGPRMADNLPREARHERLRPVDSGILLYAIRASPEDAGKRCRHFPTKGS